MRTRVFNFYADPGHGWLKVPKALLVQLQIAERITSCSYMRGDYAYLEEDCDLSVFMEAMRAAGIPHELKGHTCANRASKIRNYPYYRS